jgi:hypothetical protein
MESSKSRRDFLFASTVVGANFRFFWVMGFGSLVFSKLSSYGFWSMAHET